MSCFQIFFEYALRLKISIWKISIIGSLAFIKFTGTFQFAILIIILPLALPLFVDDIPFLA